MKRIYVLFAVLLCSTVTVFAQTPLRGKITDARNGSAITGASVQIRGTDQGTTTAADGSFSLDIKNQATLLISSIGFKSKTITASPGDNLNIILEAEASSLSEVVVTALGILREKNTLPYAAQQVKGDEVSKSRNSNFIDGLSGKVSGVQITQNNGLGSSRNVIIRGFKSLSGNNQALFVVDGTPIDNSNTNTFYQNAGGGGYDYGNAAADINPDDIESVNILRGAAATALYGSRAANGVILITTKKASKGLGITLNIGSSFGAIDKKTFPKYQHEYGAGYGPLNAYGSPDGNFFYFDVDGDGTKDLVTPTTEDATWGAKFDPNLSVFQWNAFDKTSPFYKKATPWMAGANDPYTFFEHAFSYNIGLNLSGGNDKVGFKLGYNRNEDKGILPNSRIKKDLLNFGSTYEITEKLIAGAAINFSKTNGLGRYGTGYDPKNPMNSFRQWWQMNLDVKELKDAYFRTRQNTTWNWSDPRTEDGLTPIYWNNPYWDRYENYQNDTRSRYFGNINLTYDIASWLSATGRVSLDSYDEIHEERNAIGSIASFLAGDPSPRTSFPSGYSRLNRGFREYNWDAMLNFDQNLSTDLNLKALIGGNIRQTNINSILAVTNGGLVVPRLYSLSNSVSSINAPVENETKIQVDGLFAGATFTYKEMLILDGTIRRDHSSTLPKSNSKYYYPSVSVGFVPTKIPSLSALSWLSYAKIRANYAEVGNSAPALSIKDVYNKPTPFGGATLFGVPATKNNSKLKPERTESYEIGLEANFVKNRIGLDVSYYKSNSVDQILPVAVSTATGYDYEFVNAGEIENHGVEATLNLTPIKTSNFQWDVKLNWSKNISEVKSLFGPDSTSVLQLGTFQGGVSINAVPGEPYGQIRGSNFIYTNGQRTVKANGYYDVTPLSNGVIGNAYPDWIGGVQNTFRYKNISLGFLIDVRQGGEIFSLDLYYGLATGLYPETAGLNDLGNPVRNKLADGGGIILPGVTADGKANTKRVDISQLFGAYGYYRNPAAAFVYDASFVKLRELTLTYSLPKSVLNSIGGYFKGVDFTVFGRNLFILHKNLPYSDPEDLLSSGNIQGYQSGAYPTTRVVGANLKFTF
jgi:TonB-linked SusC/RagA family outer membrane protein